MALRDLFSARSPRNAYQDALAAHRRLAGITDLVLAEATALAHVTTPEAFRREAEAARAEAAAGKPPRPGAAASEAVVPRTNKLAVRLLALACRAAEVALQESPWHHQVLGALLLHEGRIVEMPNGAGKTLMAALAAALNVLHGDKVHVVTSNDYLAERDVRWMGPLCQRLGISIGVVFSDQSRHFEHGVLEPDGVTLRVAPKPGWIAPPEAAPLDGDEAADGAPRPEASSLPHETTGSVVVDAELTLRRVFESDVVYGRIESFGFAYLRDHLAVAVGAQILPRRDLLIVDECDDVLLDDLRTPLMLSQSGFSFVDERLHNFARAAEQLRVGIDFTADGSIQLTYEGVARLCGYFGTDIYTSDNAGIAHGVVAALRARHLHERDVDYIVRDGDIVLVDRQSGRLLIGRRLGDGLDAALRIREGLPVWAETPTRTVARMTIKHFVKTYRRVAGMSGAVGDPREYLVFYGLDVVSVDPFAPTRVDHPDLVYSSKREARQALLGQVSEWAKRGHPVLINVPTLRDLDQVRRMFVRHGIECHALDARNLADEAELVRRAGQAGRITLCSKVAARGTDIVLDAAARAADGLVVIGLERGRDRRYDDQLRGRAGRHGDPGHSLFILSLEDEILQLFGSERVKRVMERLGMEEGEAIGHTLVTRAVRTGPRRIAAHDRDSRVLVVEFDDVMDRHRSVFYDVRQRLLTTSDAGEELAAIADNYVAFRSRTTLKGAAMDGALVEHPEAALGAVAHRLGRLESGRILRIRNARVRQRALSQAIAARLPAGEEARDRIGIILARLDAGWTAYLAVEEALRDEIGLYRADLDLATDVYSRRMEDKFDTFFYDVGEATLADALREPAPVAP